MIADPLAGNTIGSPEGSFVIAEWTDEGETNRDFPIAPLHVHRTEDEAWYVLEGRLGFRVGDEEVEASAGSAVLVPTGVAHSYWNAGAGTARYLLIMGPKTFRLIEEIHTAPDAEGMRELFRKYDSELLL